MATPQGSLSLRQYGASPGSHAHAHFQVLLGLDGVLELEVQGRGQRIGSGQGCVIAPGERHDFEARSGSRCLVLDTAQTSWAACPVQPARPAQALALAHYLAQALAQPASLAQHYGPLLLLDAWRVPGPASRRRERPIDWARLTHWTRQHLHEALSVAQLAQQVFLSPSRFAERCRDETGLSVMQWLRSQRLALAVQLRDGGLSVAETAQRCGYQSPSALTAALRRLRPH
ncbi:MULTISPECIES: AraC family transcriptional regulator [Comamonadaceae]|jgi:AraC-like DNA-binding protein|uniref:helix-turn-helix transcriptional regulator n=1 Tax=Comamonadaceae TaxID=80864 RepID=UPI000BD7C5D7|nr:MULTISPECIES: AraC family transcriptional regulator [Comamonadaceae]OYY33043.1 MAG: AraC family transcriptional regulator [Polaromonas sp. 35-63-35]OYZ17222.1 MAG: AraC family transcriptional regulator [Polaromonas sp. 16-63-31]OYZ76474.1 MAG: AraC family transcriptional regulator [Polaromonas sp. 24-63-21]OZA47581.1 MAG: AraC family transcriptional regulator [Polaromonas sp. 17-63-33]OZA85661.1 MAG: AraC family transcriptional regulator [Polaromonas sp. 39-63-25]